MQLSDLRTEIRDITNTDTNSYSDTDLDRKLNLEYKRVIHIIMQASGNKNNFGSFAHDDLVKADGLSEGDKGYNGEYPLPTDCLAVIRIEVKYDEDQKPKQVYDQAVNGLSEFVESDLKSVDGIRFLRNSILLRPLPTKDVTKGLYIEYIALPGKLSNNTDEPNFSELMHDVLILGTARRYYLKHPDKYNELIDVDYRERKEELKEFINDRFQKNLKFKPFKENFK